MKDEDKDKETSAANPSGDAIVLESANNQTNNVIEIEAEENDE